MVKRRKLIGVIASVLLAAVGTGLLVTYVRSAEHRALEGEKQVGVLVVDARIPKGTKAEEIGGRVRNEQVPSKVVATGAMADLAAVAGQVTAVDLLPGEQLVRGRFATPSEAGRADVPAGLLQVTVSLEAVKAMGGTMRNGDTVGVLASFDDPETTHLILQKVLVTGVRTEDGVPLTTPAAGPAPIGKLLITMALTAPSVERVVFAAEHGRLWLSAEPKEADEGGTKVQTRAEVNL